VKTNRYIYTAVQFALQWLLHNHGENMERKRIVTSFIDCQLAERTQNNLAACKQNTAGYFFINLHAREKISMVFKIEDETRIKRICISIRQ